MTFELLRVERAVYTWFWPFHSFLSRRQMGIDETKWGATEQKGDSHSPFVPCQDK